MNRTQQVCLIPLAAQCVCHLCHRQEDPQRETTDNRALDFDTPVAESDGEILHQNADVRDNAAVFWLLY
jgi:hypothetical protein